MSIFAEANKALKEFVKLISLLSHLLSFSGFQKYQCGAVKSILSILFSYFYSATEIIVIKRKFKKFFVFIILNTFKITKNACCFQCSYILC